MVVRDFVGRYGLNYAHEGRLSFSADHQRPVVVMAPVAWVSRPGHMEYGSAGGSPWSNRYINFTGPRVARYIESGLLVLNNPLVPVRQGKRFRAAFDELFDFFTSPRFSQPRSVHMLEGLLLLLSEQRTLAETPAPRVAATDAWCREIEKDPARPHLAQKQADAMGLSLSGFRKTFHALTGLAPHQFILRSRMEKAATLLKNQKRTVGEVGSRVGFPDLYGFSRHFKKHFGLSPRQWREENHPT
jgi:AraC-like DNA-binding protein